MKIKTTIILCVALSLLLSTINIFNPIPKVKAITGDHNIGFAKTYDGNDKDLTITGPGTVALDGEHTFHNLTIENGATLTHNEIDANGNTVPSDYWGIRWKGYINLPDNFEILRILWADRDDQYTIGVRKVGSTEWRWGQEWTLMRDDSRCGREGKLACGVAEAGKMYPGLSEIEIDYRKAKPNNYTGDQSETKTKLSYKSFPTDVNDPTKPSSKILFINENMLGGNGANASYYSFSSESAYDSVNPPTVPFSNFGSEAMTQVDQQVKLDLPANTSPINNLGLGGLKLNITGTLKLDGGSIDVSGKGYPGGGNSGGEKVYAGYGPGGGESAEGGMDPTGCDDASGGGGGFGGAGGSADGGICHRGAGGQVYGDRINYENIVNLNDKYGNSVADIFGSGGGGGIHKSSGGDVYGTGGNGGGSIRIVATNVVQNGTINANGYNPGAYSAAGSGGLVFIKATNSYNASAGGNLSVLGMSNLGQNSTPVIPPGGGAYGNISANGGEGKDENGARTAGGGGGRIIIIVGSTRQGGKLITIEVTYPENGVTKTYTLKSILQDLKDLTP